MITLIDNYDSFTFNLYHELLKKNEVQIFKNDEIKNMKPRKVPSYLVQHVLYFYSYHGLKI